MGSPEEQGQALMQQAIKKAAPGGFFSNMFSAPGQKFEDAAELFRSAANQFKLAKNWKSAGEAFAKSAEMHIKANIKHEAATDYMDASKVLKKVDPTESVNYMDRAVNVYLEMGKFAIAAKHLQAMAEIYEGEAADLDKAMDLYRRAAEYFEGEDSGSSASKCKLKVAFLCAQAEKYDEAVTLYEEVASSYVDSNLMKWSAKELFLKAGLCRVCTKDLVAARRAIDGYTNIFAGFRDTREDAFLKNILAAAEEADTDKFTKVVAEFDAVQTLDSWMTTILLRIKKGMESEELM